MSMEFKNVFFNNFIKILTQSSNKLETCISSGFNKYSFKYFKDSVDETLFIKSSLNLAKFDEVVEQLEAPLDTSISTKSILESREGSPK